MRIGIDARLWSQTGIGRYIRNICLGLQEIDKNNDYVLFVRSSDKDDVKKVIKDKNWKIVKSDFWWHSMSEQTRFPKIINKENLDVMHFTYQQGVPVFYKKAYVMTIHDLIKHHFMTGRASTGPIWLYGFKMLSYKILINLAAKNASKIIAISNSTKNEIFDHLLVNKSNVEVIYEAADDFGSKPQEKDLKLGKYFLYVGNVYPHKNVDNMIKAFKEVSENKDIKLVFIGSDDYFYSRLKKQASKLIKENKIKIIENASDEDLANYYKSAVALIRPSFMEGFSLPPLEAMSLSCIVLASDISVHKEVYGSAPIYFNPNDYIDIKSKMNYVLGLDEKRKKEKVNEGKLIVNKYSWKKTAKETLKVYESCAGIRQVK